MTPRKASATSTALAASKKAVAEANEAERRTELARQAHALRLEGRSWWQISEELKITEALASGLVSDAIKEASSLADEGAKRQMLSLEIARLDALQRAVWAAAMTGDTRSVETALKIIAQRSKLLGLDDAIAGKQVTNNTIVVPGNPVEYVAALRAMGNGGNS